MKDPKYDIEMNRRFRVGRAIARQLVPVRSQELTAAMLNITETWSCSRGYVDKLEAGALYKLAYRLTQIREGL